MGRGGETGVCKYGESRTGSSSALVEVDLNYSSESCHTICGEQQKQEMIWCTGTELQMCSTAEMFFSQ